MNFKELVVAVEARGTEMNDEKLALLSQQIAKNRVLMERRIEEALFRTDPLYAHLPKPKPTPRWKRIYWRVRGYLVTLWWALRGDDLEHPNDDY